jgi:hypothetical protein
LSHSWFAFSSQSSRVVSCGHDIVTDLQKRTYKTSTFPVFFAPTIIQHQLQQHFSKYTVKNTNTMNLLDSTHADTVSSSTPWAPLSFNRFFTIYLIGVLYGWLSAFFIFITWRRLYMRGQREEVREEGSDKPIGIMSRDQAAERRERLAQAAEQRLSLGKDI